MEHITIHTSEDFEGMRKAGKLAAQVLDYIEPYVKEGVATIELNNLCHDYIISHGAIPAPLNYKGFPKSICTSVNHVVCHGIPGDKVLSAGDIINIDVTVILDGWHGDTSRTFIVPTSQKQRMTQVTRLVNTTYEAMMLGIEQVAPGKHISEISRAIQEHVHKAGYSIVREYCGHGIGKIFHTDPYIVHYLPKGFAGSPDDLVLQEGMFFTIEPMINVGGWETILSKHDGWTVTTKDKTLSAQFEHTIGVTSTGYEIFTLS